MVLRGFSKWICTLQHVLILALKRSHILFEFHHLILHFLLMFFFDILILGILRTENSRNTEYGIWTKWTQQDKTIGRTTPSMMRAWFRQLLFRVLKIIDISQNISLIFKFLFNSLLLLVVLSCLNKLNYFNWSDYWIVVNDFVLDEVRNLNKIYNWVFESLQFKMPRNATHCPEDKAIVNSKIPFFSAVVVGVGTQKVLHAAVTKWKCYWEANS